MTATVDYRDLLTSAHPCRQVPAGEPIQDEAEGAEAEGEEGVTPP